MSNIKIISTQAQDGLEPKMITHEEAVNALYLMEITADLVIFETNQKIVHNYITEQKLKDQAHEELKRDVKRFIELLMKDNHTGRDTFDIEILKDKLMKVGHCSAEIEWPAEPVAVPGILFIAPANVTISERTYKDLKTELRLLKGDVKCCEIEEIRPLVPHIGAGKLNASKHLLEHIERIERLLGVEEPGKKE